MNGSGQSTFSTYLDKLENLGIEPSLSGILALCRELDDPQTKFDLIQVTGTNGKTSTSRIIQSLLTAHGLRVGVYTSPHLISYRERIMVDGAEIAEDDFVAILEKTSQFVTGTGGVISDVERWGKKRLAYPIDHFMEGSYVLIRFKLKPTLGKELKANLQISEDVLRHLLIRVDG